MEFYEAVYWKYTGILKFRTIRHPDELCRPLESAKMSVTMRNDSVTRQLEGNLQDFRNGNDVFNKRKQHRHSGLLISL